MTHYMPLSRAARLVGVSRNTLQKKIRAGDLSTFEGQVAIEELLRVYPQTQLEDSTLLERAQHIMDYALNKPSGQSLQIPDVETLISRISRISSELAQTKVLLRYQTNLLQAIQQQLEQLSNSPESSRFTTFQHWFEVALQQRPTFTDPGNPLAVKNLLLQIIAAEVTFWPSGHEFLQEGADTLLEAALQAGYNPSYGCHDGRCGRCKARLLAGQTKPVRHLQAPWPTADGPTDSADPTADWVYLCRHTAVTNVTLELQEINYPQDIPQQHLVAQCDAIQRLNEQMLLVNLSSTTPQRLQYLAGQAVTLGINQGANTLEIVADLASCPCEERTLQFHIPAHSEFGQALQQTPYPPILVHNPHGEFVLSTTQLQPLLFIAYENGFAPIKSLIQHALALDIAETIDLYWITHTVDGHYEDNVCRAWHDALDNFNYTPLLGTAADPELLTEIMHQHPKWMHHTLYLAGAATDIELTQHRLQQAATTPLTLYTKVVS